VKGEGELGSACGQLPDSGSELDGGEDFAGFAVEGAVAFRGGEVGAAFDELIGETLGLE
jgi:hypothetical protein